MDGFSLTLLEINAVQTVRLDMPGFHIVWWIFLYTYFYSVLANLADI